MTLGIHYLRVQLEYPYANFQLSLIRVEVKYILLFSVYLHAMHNLVLSPWVGCATLSTQGKRTYVTVMTNTQDHRISLIANTNNIEKRKKTRRRKYKFKLFNTNGLRQGGIGREESTIILRSTRCGEISQNKILIFKYTQYNFFQRDILKFDAQTSKCTNQNE